MSKIMNVTLNIQFSDKMTPDQKKQVVRNLADALKHEINTRGIVPDDFEGFTKTVNLVQENTGFTVTVDIVTNKIEEYE